MQQYRRKQISALPSLDWRPKAAAESIEMVYQHVCALARTEMHWYSGRRRDIYKYGAVILHAGAALCVTSAAVVPMLPSLWSKAPDPILGSILLALGGGLLAIDRYLRVSSNRVRYLMTAQKIELLLREFEMNWAALAATREGRTPDIAQVHLALRRCKAFLLAVLQVVQNETNEWAVEYREGIKAMTDQLAAESAEVTKRDVDSKASLGGVIVELQDWQELDDEWEVLVDGASLGKARGKRTVITGIPEGMRSLRVVGRVGDQEREENFGVKVQRGDFESVQANLGGPRPE